MLFPEEDTPHLKKWIVKRIENTSDADADVLADYVLALLRHDGSPDDVRKLCESEIPDFLKEDPSAFVNDVFETLSHKLYLPGARPPPLKAPPTIPHAPLPPGALSYDDVPMTQPPTAQNGAKKRGFDDGGDADAPQNGPKGRAGKRAMKQGRRGGRGGRGDEQNGNHENGMPPAMPGFGGQFPNFGAFDPASMNSFMAMAASAQPGFQVPPPPGRRMQRCRDYDTKGYCARGNTCNFQHGEYNTLVPPAPVGSFGVPGSQPQALGGADMQTFQYWPTADQGEYDPTNALMVGMLGAPNFGQQLFTPERGGHNQKGRGGRNQDSRKKGRPRAPFSADGPVTDKTKSTIVVESIPEENFDEEQVRGFFSQFGTIVEVSMRPYKRLAIVKFDNWAAANAAYKSPKAIFDNRFVKVFWYKEEGAVEATTSTSGAKLAGAPTASSAPSPGTAPEIDMEEFLRKQEEAQKAHEEKMRKLEEVNRQRQELEKRQDELLVKRLEEKKKLLAKLKGVGGASAGKDSKSTEPTTQSEALRAQLAVLEAEAMLLGIDPDVEADVEADHSWAPRGGYGRGRGYPRARGYAPRGAPGAFRGRGGHHAAYAAYSLDNRPKKLAVSGVDFTVPGADESLRQYLFGIGEFTDIQSTDTTAEVTFKDRKTAEKFFYGVKLNNGSIPGIDSPVELAWVGGSAGSTPTPGTVTPSGVSANKGGANARLVQDQQQQQRDEDGMVESSGVSVSSDKDVHITLDRAADQMDYDVADPNQWDME